MAERIEHDLLGDRAVPDHVLYGVHTLRAVENFPITGTPISRCPALIVALARVKHAAALANKELGLLDASKADAIVDACLRIAGGEAHEHFVVDVIQGGAGTSTNMNANEVIANLGLAFLGRTRGDYRYLHPNDDVNLSQSTNDVYPTALRLAGYQELMELIGTMAGLEAAFDEKAREFADVLKMGRTQLQDAVPMTLGQEFGAYAETIAEDRRALLEASRSLCAINLGATAIGTGINTHPDYASTVCRHLRLLTGIALTTSPNLIEATQDVGAFLHVSGALKRTAVRLSKICNDLRLLSSGPQAGLGEINLPPMQAGSSIMPGKVNPVIPEVVNQVAFEVIGNDMTITMAAEAGQLQLNAFEPIIAYSLHKSIRHLIGGCRVLNARCVAGISANRGRLQGIVEGAVGIVTALNPYIGYANAVSVAQEALATGRGVRAIVLERALLDETQLLTVLQPEKLTRPFLPSVRVGDAVGA